MSRIIQLFILVAGAVWLAVWFADHPGRVEIEMLGYAIYTEQVGLLVGGVVLFTTVVAVLYQVWRSLRRAPRRIVEYRRASKRQRGYRALTQGMVAVAAGDSKEAKRFARRSGKLLNNPPLTMLLSAQAAHSTVMKTLRGTTSNLCSTILRWHFLAFAACSCRQCVMMISWKRCGWPGRRKLCGQTRPGCLNIC